MKFYEEYIEVLGNDEVFVFGSNLYGFHGAGSAGYASFCRAGNIWREEKYDEKPHGWKGCWNVKGCAEGFQKGTIGKSYAIPTVERAGAKRSRTALAISLSIKSFYAFALSQPKLKFFVAQDAKMGLNGYTGNEMVSMFLVMRPPENVYFYKPFWDILKLKIESKNEA